MIKFDQIELSGFNCVPVPSLAPCPGDEHFPVISDQILGDVPFCFPFLQPLTVLASRERASKV